MPHESTHGENWVYATWDIVMSAAFLGTAGGDFTCQVGRDDETGIPFIVERFEGALKLRYGNVRGSIYVLPGDKFVAGKTQWPEEVICSESVASLQELQVEDVEEHLLQLAREHKLRIIRYSERNVGDDEDLVYRAVIWTRQFGDSILDQIKRYHPHLYERVLQAMKEGKY